MPMVTDRTGMRRFEAIKPAGVRVRNPNPAALRDARSIFPSRVYDQADRPRLLVSGVNSRKIGKAVAKGRWRVMPIFTLTLEERATCPRSCREWATCYGNNMNWALRIAHGAAFETRLIGELAAKHAAHPAGFVVRLHILGDFYSEDYARLWAGALAEFPALRVFGYTAHHHRSPIGRIVDEMLSDRCAIRFSGHDGPMDGAIVVDSATETEHLICPAQTGRTDCCATCALCWQSSRTIAFLRH